METKKEKWNAYMRAYRKKNYNPEKERKRQKQKYLQQLTGYFYLYYLPEEHYVGITNNMYVRMKHHKYKNKYIEDVEIIAKFERQVDAHLYETKLHSMGYEGFFVGHYKE